MLKEDLPETVNLPPSLDNQPLLGDTFPKILIFVKVVTLIFRLSIFALIPETFEKEST